MKTIRYKEREFNKKVILINPQLARKCFTVQKVAKKLKKLGREDWAYLQAIWLMKAVEKCENERTATADITKMFSRDFIGEDEIGMYVLPRARIRDCLLSELFNVDSETEDELRLKLKWRAIF